MSAAYLTHQAASGRLMTLRYSAGRGVKRLELVTPAGRKATAVELGAWAGIPARSAPATTTRLPASPAGRAPQAGSRITGLGTTQGGT